jgi:hypothetical protein
MGIGDSSVTLPANDYNMLGKKLQYTRLRDVLRISVFGTREIMSDFQNMN